MLLEKQDYKIFGKYDDVLSAHKVDETFRIIEEIFEGLDTKGLNEIFGGYDSDIDNVYNVIADETYKTVFGRKTEINDKLGYLDHLTGNIDEVLCNENLTYFITSKMSNFELNWHHLEWGDIAQRYKKANIIAARDHGKSYFWSNAYFIWKAWRYKKLENPRGRKDLAMSKRGYLFSFSKEQATDLLEIIKTTVEDNDELREKLYPGTGDGWAKTDITFKNKARITTKGFGSSVRGAHPGYIVVDDGLKDNVIYSSVQRKKSIDYFQAVIMNMIVPNGQVIVVGTPFHANDLYGDLKTKKGWHVREYPAIFPDGTILWNGRWKLEDLLEKRESQGNLIFSRENLVRPVTNESTIFPESVIKKAYAGMDSYKMAKSRSGFKMKFDQVVTSIDFSISSNVGADYTVITTSGIDEDGTIWIMDILRFKGRKFAEQIAAIKKVDKDFRPDLILMEDNVFQQIFVDETKRFGLPVEGHTTGKNKHDLKYGLPGLALLFERGKIKIPRGDERSRDMSDKLATELMSVTWTEKGLEGVSEHDDMAMSLWLNSVAARRLSSGFKYRFL